jgi:hypothetical protein
MSNLISTGRKIIREGFQIPNTNATQYNGATNSYTVLGITPNLSNSGLTTFRINCNITIPKDFNKIEYLSLLVYPTNTGRPFTITTEIRQVDPILHSPLALASATDNFNPNYLTLGALNNYYQHQCVNAATIIQNNAAIIAANGGFLTIQINVPAGTFIATRHLQMILSYE